MSNIEELQEVYASMMHASSTEQVFGALSGDEAEKLSKLKKTYKNILQVIFPDYFNDDLDAKDMANEATGKLHDLYKRAKQKVESGKYGENTQDFLDRTMLETSKGVYYFDFSQPIAEGDKSLIYLGNSAQAEDDDLDGKVIAKVLDDCMDNDLATHELSILERFMKNPGVQNKHLPVLIDNFRTSDGSKAIILRFIEAESMPQILAGPYPNGVPVKYAISIMSRMLSILGFVHSKGTVHCNIEPEHILLHRPSHNAFLVDWAYASFMPFQTNGKFEVINEPFSPPEVLEGKIPSPSADLYSLAKCIVYILGGNPKTNEMPAHIDERFVRFVEFFLRDSAVQRPRDAWDMWKQLANLRQEMFGDHKFEKF